MPSKAAETRAGAQRVTCSVTACQDPLARLPTLPTHASATSSSTRLSAGASAGACPAVRNRACSTEDGHLRGLGRQTTGLQRP